MAVDMSMSRTRGRASASARVRQSRTIWVSSLRVCAKIRLIVFSSILGSRNFAFLPCLLNNANEDILHRETLFPHVDHANAVRLQLFPRRLLTARDVFVGNDVKP